MIGSTADRLVKRPARWAYDEYMHRLGIGNTMRISKMYNRARYAARYRHHRRAFDRLYDRLLIDNGYSDRRGKNNVMRDGWALDTSCTLPHLRTLLDDVDPLLDERGGIKDPKRAYPGKPFFQNLMQPGDMERYPSFLDFILSSEVLETVGRYMHTVPVLSKTMPPGVRFVESYAAYEEEPNPPLRSSQNFHLDIHDSPLVYVLVLLREVTMEHGPWCFLPASVSQRAKRAIGYQRRRCDYRVSDERMYQHVDKSELIPLTYPAGTVLFIDSSRCFHYGSRNSVKPRFMLMYAFTTPARTDMTLTHMDELQYPLSESDSALRKLVLSSNRSAPMTGALTSVRQVSDA